MAKYKLKTGTEKLFIGYNRVKPGEVVELNEAQAKAFKDIIVKEKPASKRKSEKK